MITYSETLYILSLYFFCIDLLCLFLDIHKHVIQLYVKFNFPMSDSFTTIIEEVSFLLIKKTSRVVEGAVHYREKYIYIYTYLSLYSERRPSVLASSFYKGR